MVSLTQAAADHLRKVYPAEMAGQRLVVIPTCADLDRFVPRAAPPAGPRVYGCIGTVLSGWFRLDWLAAFIAAAAGRDGAARFDIVTRDDAARVDEGLVRERAIYHGVTGLLMARAAHLADWPQALRARLRAEALAQTMWEVRHRSVIVPLLAALDAAGVHSVLLKGTALAYGLYPAPAQRNRGDTDLLVAPEHLDRTRTILTDQGFVTDLQMAETAAPGHQESWSFTASDGSHHEIDLHVDVFSSPAVIRRGRLWQAWREARGLEAFFGAGRGFHVMRAGLREAVVPDWLRRVRAKWRARSDHLPKGNLLAPNVALRVDLAGRIARSNSNLTIGIADQGTQRARTITATPLVVGRERYDRVAASCGIEPRDPFMDIRLVQFCLSLPQSQVERDGWRKIILRRAMAGVLPDTVRWRKGKEHLGGAFISAMLAQRKVETDTLSAMYINHYHAFQGQKAETTGQDGQEVITNHEYLAAMALSDWQNYFAGSLIHEPNFMEE